MEPEELDNLVSRSIDRELAADEQAALDDRLASDPAARRRAERMRADHERLAAHFAAGGADAEAVVRRVRRRAARPPMRLWRVLLPTAAAVLIGAVLWILFGEAGPATAELRPIEVKPISVEITVFNQRQETDAVRYGGDQGWGDQFGGLQQISYQREYAGAQFDAQVTIPFLEYAPDDLQGMVLVKDRRLVTNLRRGDNLVRYTNVAATIDPFSVRFESRTDPAGTSVVEQNFEYDLATADAILKRYIDRRITCVEKDGGEVGGYLCSYDGEAVVLRGKPLAGAAGGRTQTVSRGELMAIRLPDVPEDLHTRPTLVWKVRTKRPGPHETLVTYLAKQMVWRADYVAILHPGAATAEGMDDRIDLTGWVTMTNQCGSTFQNAGIKLIAGDVNRVRDPWAARPYPLLIQDLGGLINVNSADYRVLSALQQFAEKSFFEYHLYTLSAPSTVRDRQVKQLSLLSARGAEAVRRYWFSRHLLSGHLEVRLECENAKENRLGMPLPKGVVRFMQADPDGDLQYIGQTELDHTPADERLDLRLGTAFDVVGERRDIELIRVGPNRWRRRVQVRVRNHKAEAIRCRVDGRLDHAEWRILESSDPWRKHDFRTIRFDFPLGADTEKVVTYTVEYRH
jgi:hypothetical protein